MSTRKRRTDRNHVIYQLVNKATAETYIGITVAQGRAYKKSARSRWLRHIYRATVEQANLPLSIAIRQHTPEAFVINVLEVVRGKANAHSREFELIELIQPQLNVLGKQTTA